MAGLDWVIIAGYFALLAGVAWWVIRKNKDTADDYFLAGRNLGWFVIGASIFASNIGSEHLVGLAGSGTTDGVAMAHYELHAWCLLILGWVMVPFYMRSKVFTMPEFLEKRYSPTARWVLSIISLVAYVLTKIAVGIFAGGMVFWVLLPEISVDIGFMTLDSFWLGSVLVIVMTGLYTVIGGLRAVAYTEAVQSIVLVLGSFLVTLFGLMKLGETSGGGVVAGWHSLRDVVGSEMFNLWKPLVPDGMQGTWAPVMEPDRIAWYFNGNFPWLGMLFAAPIIGLWYWCTDQYIVQRALGAPDEREARRGTIFAAFLKLLPVFIFIIPGMICLALAETGQVQTLRDSLYTAGAMDTAKAQAAFPLMVREVLPTGVRGLVVAGLLAALMSSLAGVFNASSTLFTMDFYRKFRPEATQHRLVWIGRIATGGMVVLGLIWVPIIRGAEQGLYFYLQGVQGYLAPPIFVVFFFGVFMKRLNAKGALWALGVGFALGLFRLGVDTPLTLGMSGFEGGYAEGSFLWIIANIYFQYYSLLIFLICAAVAVGVSYATEAPDPEQIKGLTYATVTDADRAESRSSWGWGEVAWSSLVCVLILGAYMYFNG